MAFARRSRSIEFTVLTHQDAQLPAERTVVAVLADKLKHIGHKPTLYALARFAGCITGMTRVQCPFAAANESEKPTPTETLGAADT